MNSDSARITSVLIEGGGDVLGQALDGHLIDQVRIYLGPLITGGPVVAFAGLGADSTKAGTRLRDVRYERIGNDVLAYRTSKLSVSRRIIRRNLSSFLQFN